MHELLIINNDVKVPSINSIEIKCQNNQNDWQTKKIIFKLQEAMCNTCQFCVFLKIIPTIKCNINSYRKSWGLLPFRLKEDI